MTRGNEALDSTKSADSYMFNFRGVTIPTPPRTERQPKQNSDKEWLYLVGNRWTTVCNTALDQLNSLPFSPLLRTLLEQPTETLAHTITVSKSSIRKDILGFLKPKTREDIRIAYQYFNFGREVGQDESTAAVLETTPFELFQLYAVVIARKTIIAQWLSRAGQRAEDPSQGIERKVSTIGRMMAQKPKGGGPLMTYNNRPRR